MPKKSAGSPLFASRREVASLLGCSVETIRTYEKTGELPAPTRVGGRRMFARAAIQHWLAERGVTASI